MSSDEDLDYCDSDSGLGDYNSDEDLDDCDSDSGLGDYGSDASDDQEDNAMDSEFIVLSCADYRCRIEEATSEISTQLSIPNYAAVALLCKYKWINSKIYDEWFSDEVKTRKSCGLINLNHDEKDKMHMKGNQTFFCGICLEKYKGNVKDHRGITANCGHVFCETCWTTYVSTAIESGPGCLSLRCPEPGCGDSIGYMIDNLTTESYKRKYENFILRSYVETRKRIKWCPSPGCEFVVEWLGAILSNSNMDVVCKCSYGFCWNCSEENHAPAKCDLVEKWSLKNNSELENNDWMICNTKKCPKCRKPIEKNEGCMHMTCTCRHEFCWLCMGPWSQHNDSTGGFFACNGYEVARKAGKLTEEQKIRENAENALKKYTHYFNRWIENHNSRNTAKKSLENLPADQFPKLSASTTMIPSEMELRCITLAWIQIIECRRVLKWSYAYGYYISDDETAKRLYYEFAQGEAEGELERLHDLAENELKKLAEGIDVPRLEFESFCKKVTALTKSTRNFFETLVVALANDLCDVTTK